MWNAASDTSERGAKYHSTAASKLFERTGFRSGLPRVIVQPLVSSPQVWLSACAMSPGVGRPSGGAWKRKRPAASVR